MTRKEQIRKAAKALNATMGWSFGFMEGAQWADAHPKEEGIELWVARDMSGDINLWDEEPTRIGNLYFQNDKSFHLPLGTEDFPEVTFQNSPMKVRLTLVKEGGE